MKDNHQGSVLRQGTATGVRLLRINWNLIYFFSMVPASSLLEGKRKALPVVLAPARSLCKVKDEGGGVISEVLSQLLLVETIPTTFSRASGRASSTRRICLLLCREAADIDQMCLYFVWPLKIIWCNCAQFYTEQLLAQAPMSRDILRKFCFLPS